MLCILKGHACVCVCVQRCLSTFWQITLNAPVGPIIYVTSSVYSLYCFHWEYKQAAVVLFSNFILYFVFIAKMWDWWTFWHIPPSIHNFFVNENQYWYIWRKWFWYVFSIIIHNCLLKGSYHAKCTFVHLLYMNMCPRCFRELTKCQKTQPSLFSSIPKSLKTGLQRIW